MINFYILWIEDDKKYVESTEKVIRTHLDNLGFNLEIDYIQDPENDPVEKYLETTSKYDLILVDWQFKGEPGKPDKPMGSNIIERIRWKISFADIMFYSGNPDIEDELKRKGLQGVYLSTRSSMKDEVRALIDSLLHKTLHPKIMRGIIVSELSHVDDLCYQIIKSKYLSSGTDKVAFASMLKETLKNQAEKQFADKMAFLDLPDDDFIKQIESTIFFDSHKRSVITANLLKQEGPIKNIDTDSILALPDIILKRNCLAHWKRTEETDKHITLISTGKSDYVFDQSEAAKMRAGINKSQTALAAYLEHTKEK